MKHQVKLLQRMQHPDNITILFYTKIYVLKELISMLFSFKVIFNESELYFSLPTILFFCTSTFMFHVN